MTAAEEFAKNFNPFRKDTPLYVPEDGAELYFSRVYVMVDGRMKGYANRPAHETLEEMKGGRFARDICRHYPDGKTLGILIHNYVHPGKAPGRDVNKDEFGLACMGALECHVKERLEVEYPYEEILGQAGERTEMEAGEEKTCMADPSL